jgi:hypothetical protein
MTIRSFLAPLPDSWNWDAITAVTKGRYASAIDVNVVEEPEGQENAAVYFDGYSPPAKSLDLWRADILAGASTPSPDPDPDPAVVDVAALVDGVTAVDTSQIGDPAAREAVDAIKAAVQAAVTTAP